MQVLKVTASRNNNFWQIFVLTQRRRDAELNFPPFPLSPTLCNSAADLVRYTMFSFGCCALERKRGRKMPYAVLEKEIEQLDETRIVKLARRNARERALYASNTPPLTA